MPSAYTVAADELDPPPRARSGYTPRGGCALLYETDATDVVIGGPAGTGKSRAALERLNSLALAWPGMRALIVRKTLNSLSWSALVTWEEHVVPDLLTTGEVAFFGGSTREPPSYRYRNGSRVVIGGMDKATRHMSSDYDVIFVQEAIELSEGDWESLTTRLRHGVTPVQQIFGDTNPDVPTHWLKRRADEAKTLLIESRHEDNPVYFDERGRVTPVGRAYMATLDALTGVRRSRLRDGAWVAAEGVIYETWDTTVHLVDPYPIPTEWARLWVVDFGYTNPFVLQCWAVDPDGRLVLYREIYHTSRLVEDHARTIIEAVTAPAPGVAQVPGEDVTDALAAGRRVWIEPEPAAVICDHDAEGRATLERYLHRGTRPAKKGVTAGIEAVQSRLRLAGDGRPRLELQRDVLVERDQALWDAKLPTCTAEEVPGYVWLDGKAKEQPVKLNDHGLDCVRYLVADRDLTGGPPRFRGWLD